MSLSSVYRCCWNNKLTVNSVIFCTADRTVGDLLPLGGSNYAVITGFTSCQLWSCHHCCHENQSRNELELLWRNYIGESVNIVEIIDEEGCCVRVWLLYRSLRGGDDLRQIVGYLWLTIYTKAIMLTTGPIKMSTFLFYWIILVSQSVSQSINQSINQSILNQSPHWEMRFPSSTHCYLNKQQELIRRWDSERTC